MKNLAIIFVLFFSLISFSQTKNYLDKPYYETSATVDTLVTPDKIFININISESDTKGKVSIEQLERKMYNTLKSIGIDTDKNLKVNDMSSNYKKYILKKKDILKEKSFSLQVDNAKTLTKVFVSLEEIGISNTNIQKIKYSKYEEVQFLLKQKALKKAKAEAKIITKSIGQNIGKAIHIADRNYNRSYQAKSSGIMLNEVGRTDNNENKPLDIEFKKIKISSTINVIFELN